MATIRQKELAKRISENIRKDGQKAKSIGWLMIEAGYSKSTSFRSTQVTRSKGFQEVLEEGGISDAKLCEVIKKGLEATKLVPIQVRFIFVDPATWKKWMQRDKKILIEAADHDSRFEFVKTILRLCGHKK